MDKLEMWMYVAGELVLDVLDKLSSCPAAAARVPLIRLSGKLRSSPLLSSPGLELERWSRPGLFRQFVSGGFIFK